MDFDPGETIDEAFKLAALQGWASVRTSFHADSAPCKPTEPVSTMFDERRGNKSRLRG